MKINIIKPNHFCLGPGDALGIADSQGTFASSMWCIDDEAFNSISGNRFGWYAPNGQVYSEDRSIFSRPTDEQIKALMTPAIKKLALEQGLITINEEVNKV